MASDTEDAVTSAALISSIREKIVDYKEFLLRYVTSLVAVFVLKPPKCRITSGD
jgi:hypothetical protein